MGTDGRNGRRPVAIPHAGHKSRAVHEAYAKYETRDAITGCGQSFSFDSEFLDADPPHTVQTGLWGLVVALPLMFAVGGHWAVLQTVAWAGMVVSYSQDNSLGDAISMTFDGAHPCKMCKIVKEGRADEQQQPATLKAEFKIDFFLEIRTVSNLLPPVLERERVLTESAPPRFEPPLLHPPIFA